jgi:uncharacterized protein (TIGR03086 family)
MGETADRYRKVAAGFSERVAAVPADGWERPAPCEGWVARDVVRHLVDTAGFFVGRAGIEMPEPPPVEDDPEGAWESVRAATQAVLDDPDVAGQEVDSPMGRTSLESLIGRFGVADVLVHTWDLARATGLDETLDPDEVRRTYEMMLPNDEMMRGTAFGPKVDVPADADPQTKLIAFTGRRP